MLQSFKKLLTSDPILNDVQQNVFDTVTEIQKTSFVELTKFSAVDGISNNSWTQIGDVMTLSEGEYALEVGATFDVRYSSLPTYTNGALRVLKASSLENLTDALAVAVPIAATGFLRAFTCENIIIKTPGIKLILQANIDCSGGTVSSRNVRNAYFKVQRRFV